LSPEELTLIEETRTFLDDLVIRGIPLQTLLNTGTFPDGWPERYLNFLDRVAHQYPGRSSLPHAVMAVLYNASVYCTKRYLDWQRDSGSTNDATEQVVNRIRWSTDAPTRAARRTF